MKLLTCKTCGIERETIYFNKTKTNDKYYYSRVKCRVCRSKSGRVNLRSLEGRKISDSVNVSKECLDYLNAIKRRNGLISDIDFYLIAHYHIQIFSYKETCYNTPIEEILIMYKQLMELIEVKVIEEVKEKSVIESACNIIKVPNIWIHDYKIKWDALFNTAIKLI